MTLMSSSNLYLLSYYITSLEVACNSPAHNETINALCNTVHILIAWCGGPAVSVQLISHSSGKTQKANYTYLVFIRENRCKCS